MTETLPGTSVVTVGVTRSEGDRAAGPYPDIIGDDPGAPASIQPEVLPVSVQFSPRPLT